MAALPNVGALRNLMTQANSPWTPDERLKDADPIPSRATGCDLTKVPKVADVPRVDIAPHLSAPTANPFLRQLRVARGYIQPAALPTELMDRATAPAHFAGATAPAAATAPVPAASASVDWRNRFGWPWLTEVKDQQQCGSCWVFAAVGVVESMTRIGHAIWSLRSEGDVHDGMGWKCANGGDPGNALNWIQANGVADPGCWAYETHDLPYKPTPDRNGRTVKLDGHVVLNNVADQKAWIDNVGPLAACFTCYWDFQTYGPNSGVYVCHTASGVDGGHCITIVGYDDSKQAWLIRNSWGTGWGMAGYCWFHYGQCDIDTNVKFGVPGVNINPDPWTKRRVHNGNLLESGDGQYHRNFEMWAPVPGQAIRHYFRDGATNAWAVSETQANDCASSPTVTASTFGRDFEMVYQTTAGRLHHLSFVQSSGQWVNGPTFGPMDTSGIPGFIQSDYGAPGNLELVVRNSKSTLEHWWRNEANNEWALSATFGANVALSGPSLVQRFDRGLDVVVVNANGTMQRYWRDDAHSKPWAAAEAFGSGVNSPPVMIRSQFGMADETRPGNYELCVAVHGSIQHWWTAGESAASWALDATFGANVQQVLGLIESSYGFDLEVIALLGDGSLQHFYRNNSWNAGPVIATATQQAGWRWCHKCQGMFYGDGVSKGTCPVDHLPHDGTQSGRYAERIGEDAPGQQGNWRWCHKCQGLFYGGSTSKGTCPADHQPHDGTQSSHYVALSGEDGTDRQGNWRWCHKCQGMFYNGNASKGTCPVDAKPHDGTESAHYASIDTVLA